MLISLSAYLICNAYERRQSGRQCLYGGAGSVAELHNNKMIDPPVLFFLALYSDYRIKITVWISPH